MDKPQPLIQVDALERHFGDVQAVCGVSFTLERGEVVGLLGPNGAGKSTTMKMIAGVLAPSAGAVRLAGIDLLTEPEAAKRHLGYAPENPPLYRELTVREYLRHAAALRGVARGERAAAVDRACGLTGLADAGGRLIANLSKGYRQRVGIAQAIVHRPPIVLLDEPSSGLDPNQMREIRALVSALGREHGVLLSTHMLGEVQTVCDRAIIMHRGTVALDEPLATLDADTVVAHRITLGEPGADDADTWTALPGVDRLERVDAHTLRAVHDGSRTAVDALLDAGRRFGVVAFTPERRSLEELFVSLTVGDEAGSAPATDSPVGEETAQP